MEADEGARGVALAREAIAAGLRGGRGADDAAAPFATADLPPVFEEKRGVFVTLTRARSGALRGCVGFPLPIFPLRAGIPRSAWAAAVDDPRFPPMDDAELPGILIELSVLTVPEELDDPASSSGRVRVGVDGLIVRSGELDGLLLPQVAPENGWSAERFLAETCRKAGLSADAWKRPGTRVSRFQAELFKETSPGGAVRRHELDAPSPRRGRPGIA